jgi:ABC-2 type transport system permease protein
VIAVELVKQASRLRAWLVLGVMAAIPVLLTAVIGLSRPALAERVGDWGSVVTNSSGFTMPLIALSAMQLFLLPLGVAVFAGESVATEAAWGTLRYLLARPVSRTRVLISKVAVAAAFSVAAGAVASASALVSGVLAFGWRPLTVLDLQHTSAFYVASATFTPGVAMSRVFLATALVLSSVASTFGFAVLLSTLMEGSFGAVAGAVGLGLASRALDNVPGLHALGAWLPLTDSGSTVWTGLFVQPVNLDGLGHLLVVQALYTGLFLAAAWWRFTRADVLS